MDFLISALPMAAFAPLFRMTDAELIARGGRRCVADRRPGFPCRVSLEDARLGESVLLLNYEHLAVATPYRSSHAIYVREAASQAMPAVNEVPDVLRLRLLSARAFDCGGMMLDADVVEGRCLENLLERLLGIPEVAYVHLHNAKPGCYAARVQRA